MHSDRRDSSNRAAASSRTVSGSGRSSHLKQIEDLTGPAGRLEAVLNTGGDDAPFSALVCHPYPPAGGTMHTKVVYHTAKAISSFGVPVLRFNFRGVGLSAGRFADGEGEQDDVRAAIDWLARVFARPVLVAGFSFGSYVGLRACCADDRVLGRVALGLPVRAAGRKYSYDFLPQCRGPLLFLSGDDDEFCPPDVLASLAASCRASYQIVRIAGGDHFFEGTPASPQSKLSEMRSAIESWLSGELLSSPA